MGKTNIFDGEGSQPLLALHFYKRLISREWFNYENVMTNFLGKPLRGNLSSCEYYNVLKKAAKDVRAAIARVVGEGAIEIDGNQRKMKLRYVGKEDNPLEGQASAMVRKNLEDYFRFCQDSAGFFPSAWLEHFLAKTMDLFEITRRKREKRSLIGADIDRMHTNIEWLPFVYECVRDKKVIEVTYRERYQTTSTITLHPHYLKEFNGRWHIFGHAEGREPQDAFCVALDRIAAKPRINHEARFVAPQTVQYPDFFNDIVGTTHFEGAALHDITIRIHSEYMFGLMESKPLHHTQETSMPFDTERGYGEVRLRLRPNHEFYGRVLQMGGELEIVSPQEVRDEAARRILEMCERYKGY